jgi:hypothetical protein
MSTASRINVGDSDQGRVDHDRSIASVLIEQYLAGNLDERQAEIFEDHLFGCAVCTEELKLQLKRVGWICTKSRAAQAEQEHARTVGQETRSCRMLPVRRRNLRCIPRNGTRPCFKGRKT